MRDSVELKTNKKPEKPALSRVIDFIFDEMRASNLSIGQLLASERALAAETGVSRGAVRRALASLEQDGFIGTPENGARRILKTPPSKGGLLSDSIAMFIDETQKGPVHGVGNRVGEELRKLVHASGRHALEFSPSKVNEDLLNELTSNPPAGLLLGTYKRQSRHLYHAAAKCAEAGIPVVVYGSPDEAKELDRVCSNHFYGAYEITRHFLKLGKKRILQVDYDKTQFWSVERRQGYEQAMKDAGFEPFPPVEKVLSDVHGPERHNSLVRESGARIIEYLSGDNPIETIIAGSDGEVLLWNDTVRLFHKTPGKDVLISGYDNYWNRDTTCIPTPPPTVTVDKQESKLAAEMLELLERRKRNSLPRQPQLIKVQPELIFP